MSSTKLNDSARHSATSSEQQATSTPLLEEKQEEQIDKAAILPFREAVTNLVRPSTSMVVNAFFHPIYTIVNAVVLGHQDNERMLAGLGLGSLTIGIMALSIGSTFNGAVSTFISHAYGQKEYRQCQVYRNKAIFTGTVLYCILLIPLIFIRQIYSAIGQDDVMADYATMYVHYTIPFVYFYYISQIYSAFAVQQEVTSYALLAMIVGTVSHAIMVCIFYLWLDMGFRGIVLATGLMFICRASVNVGMVHFRNDVRKHDDVYLFSKETVSNLSPLVKKSFAAMSMSIWGWWSFDIFTLMATYIGPAEAGAQTIMRSIGLLTFMMPAGFASGSSIMMGKSVGQQRTNLAMQYYRIAQLASLIICAFQVTILLTFRDGIISGFTSEESVSRSIMSAWPILCTFTLFDATQSVGSALIRATGKQGQGALLTVTAYLGLGIPLAYTFGISKEMGTMGLWIGPTAACAYLTLMYNILIACIDWPSLLLEIKERRDTENAERNRILQEELVVCQSKQITDDYERAADDSTSEKKQE